ncbi:MAG: choice-of-anchor D domain-containing protein [Candidatus Kapaibacterium sp.]
MKQLNLLFLLLTWLSLSGIAYSGNYKSESGLITDEMRTKLQSKLLETRLGNEYMVVVTPNDLTMPNYLAEIYIGAKEPCKVHIEQPAGEGHIASYDILKPYDIAVHRMSSQKYEIRGKEEKPENLPLRIYSDKEIMVYFGTHASTTAEGYMALPVNVLGKHYVHCSFTSNKEGNDDKHTGFIIGAISDNTNVAVKLRGRNLAPTSGCVTDGAGHKIGDNFMLRLDEWQAINVWDKIQGADIAPGVCDFTGSTITSDKPIAVFSHHERTDIPRGARNRDCLAEQLLPVNLWGKEFVSVQLKSRDLTGTVSDVKPPLFVGDYFRVVASEPDTRLDVTWWDPRTGDEIKSLKNQPLNPDGDWWDYNPTLVYPRPAGIFGIQGIASFRANKPIQVMQYCYSTGFGIDGPFDPLMVLVPPIEQYGYETVFQTSSYADMEEHNFTILAKGDTNNTTRNEELLSTITISEKGGKFESIKDKDKNFLTNRIPTTEYFYSTLPRNGASSYAVKAQTKVAGYIYGFGKVISYGWTASMALVETSEKDTLCPEVHHVSGCYRDQNNYLDGLPDRIGQQGRYKFVSFYADTTNYPAADEFAVPQVDLGLSYAPRFLIPDGLSDEELEKFDNIEISRYVYIKPRQAPTADWLSREPVYQGAVEFTVLDMYKDALGFVEYRDRAGNITLDTLVYIADKLEWRDASSVKVEELNFGSKTVGGTYTLSVRLHNVSKKEVTISEIFLSGANPVYSLTKGVSGLPLTLGPDQSEEIEVTYIPKVGGTVIDSIMVYTDCLKFSIPIYGGSGIAKIDITDIDFGQVLVGTKTFMDVKNSQASLQITNKGSVELVVTDYRWEDPQDATTGPFFYEPNPVGSEPTPSSPIKVAAGDKSDLIRRFAFLPDKIGPFEVKLYFESNAAGLDLDPNRKDYAILRGYGIQPGPKVTSYDWGERRVKTLNDWDIELTNDGNAKLTIKEISNVLDNWNVDVNGDLVSPDGSYRVFNVSQYEGKEVYPSSGSDEPKLIRIRVNFSPQSEYTPIGLSPTNVKFYINFEKEYGISDNTIYSSLSGKGILPKISVSGYKFPATKKNEECSEVGSLVIRNTSESSKLHIKSVRFLGGQQETDFTLTPVLNNHDGTDIGIKDSIVYKVRFKPLSTAPPARIARVLIDNDATVGPEEFPIITTDTLLEGIAFDEGVDCNPIDYGTVSRCAEEVLDIVVVNESTTNYLDIINITIPDEYKDIFVIDNSSYENKQVPPNSTLTVPVRLIASAYSDEGDIITKYTLETNLGIEEREVHVRILVLPFELSMERREHQTPGTIIDFPVNIKISDADKSFTYSNANLTSFKIVFKLDPKAARVTGATGSWQYNVSTDLDAGTVTVTGQGSAWQTDGLFFSLKLQILVSSDNDFEVSFESISFNERDICVSTTNKPGSVQYTICAEDLRGIVIGANNFYIDNITPNPYRGGDLHLSYSLGFDVDVAIKLYDASGKTVKTLVDGNKKGGVHNISVNLDDLGSGAYTIIMKSGPYEHMQRLIIVK